MVTLFVIIKSYLGNPVCIIKSHLGHHICIYKCNLGHPVCNYKFYFGQPICIYKSHLGHPVCIYKSHLGHPVCIYKSHLGCPWLNCSSDKHIFHLAGLDWIRRKSSSQIPQLVDHYKDLGRPLVCGSKQACSFLFVPSSFQNKGFQKRSFVPLYFVFQSFYPHNVLFLVFLIENGSSCSLTLGNC